MTVISGRRCCALLTKSGRIGSLVKMLLVSPLWSKEGYGLKWDTKQLFSARVTDCTFADSSSATPSRESAATWSVSDIPSSRLLFRLRVSARPTAATASSFLLQTPRAEMVDETPEAFAARKARNGYKKGTKFASLEMQVKYDERFAGMLKTPTTWDAKSEEMTSAARTSTTGTLAQEMANGYAARRGLMLPTPMTQDYKKRGPQSKQRGIGEYVLDMLPTARANKVDVPLSASLASRHKGNLEEVVAKLLPTPTVNDAINQTLPPSQAKRNDSIVKRLLTGEIEAQRGEERRGEERRGEETISQTTDSDPSCAGETFRLSPLFTEELMGFPFLWTTLPFLRSSGEPSRSKPTEMPSSRK